MMTFEIKKQESYSRGELLLRTLFGFFYIVLPHAFILLFLSLWAQILGFLAFWVILFTGRYPQSWFEYQVDVQRWSLRVNARLYNLADGYPAFGLKAEDDHVTLEVEYPEQISRGSVLLRAFFGFIYVGIPHGLILSILSIGVLFVNFFAWWAVLFTGKYPQGMFDFQVEVLRWSQRVNFYLMYITQDYPPFSGKPDPAPMVTSAPTADSPQSNNDDQPEGDNNESA